MLGGHVRAVFTLITFIFIICITYTLTSFKEVPLGLLESDGIYHFEDLVKPKDTEQDETENIAIPTESNYGSVNQEEEEIAKVT